MKCSASRGKFAFANSLPPRTRRAGGHARSPGGEVGADEARRQTYDLFFFAFVQPVFLLSFQEDGREWAEFWLFPRTALKSFRGIRFASRALSRFDAPNSAVALARYRTRVHRPLCLAFWDCPCDGIPPVGHRLVCTLAASSRPCSGYYRASVKHRPMKLSEIKITNCGTCRRRPGRGRQGRRWRRPEVAAGEAGSGSGGPANPARSSWTAL